MPGFVNYISCDHLKYFDLSEPHTGMPKELTQDFFIIL